MQLDFIDDDISDHTQLDAQVYMMFESDHTKDPFPPHLVLAVIASSDKLDPNFKSVYYAKDIVEKCSTNDDGNENENLRKLLAWCWRQGTFEKIRRLKILRPVPARLGRAARQQGNWFGTIKELDAAYHKPFLGNAATDFVDCLRRNEDDIQYNKLEVHAKAICVIQSSGTGKSRMLTEIGKQIFTLPICLRDPRYPGYPLSDENAYDYFRQIPASNDGSDAAHSTFACFLAAAHRTMLKWLREAPGNRLNGNELHNWWYGIMEQMEGRELRHKFFSEVLEQAKAMKSGAGGTRPNDPTDNSGHKIQDKSESIYAEAKAAVEALMTFLADLHSGQQPLAVTYFDEAQQMGARFWVLLRVLGHQNRRTKMWYVLAEEKSSINYFTPPRRSSHSLRLLEEIRVFVRPYFALDFDQNVLKGRQEVTTRIGDLQSLEHLASYGRPMWKAQFSKEQPEEIVKLASLKLTDGMVFDDQNVDHVFAVLSQRLSIEPVLIGSEATQLAERGVSHHMRLITGLSADGGVFYTYSPSEPMLVLGAADMLYHQADKKILRQVLYTFNNNLCSSGLVEKGLPGELGARILFLLARDFAAPYGCRYNRDLLKPVRLLHMINILFGCTTWAGTDQEEYNKAFETAHVNFTHWIVTKDSLPETLDQDLLANLWARGAILQCCSNQESADFLMAVYHGDIEADAVFDPARLSAAFGEVKFKSEANTTAEKAIRPIGIPHDLSRPYPYLTLLLELANESTHETTHSKIKVTVPKTQAAEGEFQKLAENWLAAVEEHQERKPEQGHAEPNWAKQQRAVQEARLALDAYNRYVIVVRGAEAEVYDVLRLAGVECEFATLLRDTMPVPVVGDESLRHMRPLERLGGGHASWMSRYVVGRRGGKGHLMDVDL